MPPKIPYKKINISFVPEDFEKIEALAKKEKMSKSAYVRKSLNLSELEKPRSRKAKKVNVEHLYFLKKMSTNLNQIAKVANSRKQIDKYVLSELIKIREEMSKFL